MDKRTAGFWVATGILCLVMGAGGILDLTLGGQAEEIFTRLGYPLYFARMLGVAKLLGVLALVSPGMARVKEWAYAGFTFDLIAATVSHLAVGDGPKAWLLPIAVLVVGAASYALRPPCRRWGHALRSNSLH